MQEIWSSINWAVIAPLIVIQGILLIIALIDLAKTAQTNGPKWLWFLIIVFINIIGPILYFLFGRRQG
ncbi:MULTISPECIES: PLD nuclease N-terminal domain-containing protein [Virgibacillus]|uniref:PLD nuclease N-terminal domain-containing protein n=1 Tax=Virgibacillus TaxID=84406 RepID=UPI00045CE6B4|nr:MULTISPECIES: PLD nuclease N-terminal domain-containing protein [Virgibacillus]AIF42529.1 Negative regulatory protein yxlE [Virgibacillus sp. SK37]MCJ0933199.1 PLD nuclease N-terminal domain-containing protein [Virgibacillus halodenitrificans]MYL60705.1 transcriptional regulator [Virgibacillus halodenitrificans]WHX24957.1 PLD nuclease N-terminal domain-containing protein [Virgibacillus halodenitrificans]CDQ36706.1 Negative regulatory protein YxlE [Virgibacillus halodenitrificans]